MLPKRLILIVLILNCFTKVRCLPMNKFEKFENSGESYVLKNDADYYEGGNSEIGEASRQNAETKELEKRLDIFLNWYYEKFVEPVPNAEKNIINDVYPKQINDPYDQMQSDQPTMMKNYGLYDGNGDGLQKSKGLDSSSPFYFNLGTLLNTTSYPEDGYNFSNPESIESVKNKRDRELEDRARYTWIQMLKEKILIQVGRVNSSMPKSGDEMEISALNISEFMPNLQIPNRSAMDDDLIIEKIRSYYPSCEIPRNTDQDVWKDENTMNLYFNVDHGPEGNGVNIATATLRLYRVHENQNVTGNIDSNCENSFNGEEENLLRISVYWYTKSLKKHRVKRRLSDSKVVEQNSKWVELSVLPATKAWTKGKNLGMSVVVEDQEGTILKADKYFKGASCTVGTSTPKPIPTVIIDAARWANELERINGSPGRNSTTALHNNIPLPPSVDICTIEIPENVSYKPSPLHKLRIRACNLNKMYDQTQKSLEKERLEKFAALAGILPSGRHIRHQKHLQDLNVDLRSKIIGQQVVLTNQELRNYNDFLANQNFTDNR